MPKFSIIIPIYKVEKYIKKCLDSVFSQTDKDFEVLVVNDGTPDRSMEIVKEYDVKIINQKNQGQSVARNNAVKKAAGDYIIFLDSDDYWEKDLLKEIKKTLKNNPDVVRFQLRETFENKNEIIEHNEIGFTGLNGVDAFEKICKYYIVDAACPYAFKRSYYLENKFAFKKRTVHEDYGLIPLIIIKASIVNSIEYIGYNYLQREGSTMNTTSYEKIRKKAFDMFEHYKYLVEEIDKTKLDCIVFKSFIANSVIIKSCTLKGKDYKLYRKYLKKEKVYNNILTNSIPRKIKKSLLKMSPKIYYKILGK